MRVVPGIPFGVRPGRALTGLRVTVMGLGHFGGGVETVRWLAGKGARVTVTDLKGEEELAEPLEAIRGLGARPVLGRHEALDFTDTDLVVASPAVPPESPHLALAAASGVPLMTELSLTMSLLRGRSVWVTGTCGKSTTTALIGEIMRAAGIPAHVGGNIGRPLLGVAEQVREEETAVLEVSSFQLEWMARDGVVPDVAVVTNVTPNHLDRHGTFARYLAAKAAALPPSGPAVLNRDDPASREHLGRVAGGNTYWVTLRGETERGAFLQGEAACLRLSGEVEGLFELADLRLRGEFNRANALQAALASRLLGARPEAVGTAIRSFPGLSHRLEDLGVRRGVTGVNDSKATTPEAACLALKAFPGGIVLLAGGFERGADLSELATEIRARVRLLVLLGESAARLEAEVGEGAVASVRAGSLEEAVDAAISRCRPGDTLLLSPGHASWDMFANYEERGERFRRAFLAVEED